MAKRQRTFGSPFDGAAAVGSLPVCTNWCSRLHVSGRIAVGRSSRLQASSVWYKSSHGVGRPGVTSPAAASEVSPAHVVDHEVRLAAHPVAQGDIVQANSRPPPVPAWAADAVFYQLFPERFANGDKSNDPTRESLESPDIVPKNWKISPWTGDWYARADWEKQLGPNFFENGVFHRRYGGDLQGVIDKLDYLSNAGHQHDLLQPGVLRPVAAQVRRQLVSSRRSVFRPRSRRATSR